MTTSKTDPAPSPKAALIEDEIRDATRRLDELGLRLTTLPAPGGYDLTLGVPGVGRTARYLSPKQTLDVLHIIHDAL